jgi:hypothetical protein
MTAQMHSACHRQQCERDQRHGKRLARDRTSEDDRIEGQRHADGSH